MFKWTYNRIYYLINSIQFIKITKRDKWMLFEWNEKHSVAKLINLKRMISSYRTNYRLQFKHTNNAVKTKSDAEAKTHWSNKCVMWISHMWKRHKQKKSRRLHVNSLMRAIQNSMGLKNVIWSDRLILTVSSCYYGKHISPLCSYWNL